MLSRRALSHSPRLGSLTIGWPSESPLYLGTTTEGSTSYSHLRGAVDDMRVWNVARTTQQIAESMNALAQPAPAGLIGEWQFDEPGGHVIADTSGHGRDATVQDLTFGIVKGRIELPGGCGLLGQHHSRAQPSVILGIEPPVDRIVDLEVAREPFRVRCCPSREG